jgi:serine/threonine-protein kinase
MSPEQLRGEVDACADVWALGVVLYEMLTGHRPFGGDYEAALLYGILHEAPAPLDRDNVPEELAEIVRLCLEKDPGARYQSAEEVEVALERLGLGSASVAPVRRLSKRKRSLVFGVGGFMFLLAFLLLSPLRPSATSWLGLGDAPNVRHLAVLPLTTMSDEASVGEGLTLTLTSLLTQVGAQAEEPITVVPASEMRDVTTAAGAYERFGVDVVVNGDFRQTESQVYLNLNLIDARTLRQLHSERITEPEGRMATLGNRAVIALSEMLGTPLSDEHQAMLAEGGTSDSEAYRFFLQGKAAIERYDKSSNVELAVQFFEWALEKDPAYALAHAGLGEAYVRSYEVMRDPQWVRRAQDHSAQALALAGRLAPVRVTLGRLYDLTGDYAEAAREYKLAVGLDENEADAYLGLGRAYQMLGRETEAEDAYRSAIRLQPSNWRYHSGLGLFYQDVGRYGDASLQFQRVIELSPDNIAGYNNLGTSFLYLGNFKAAEAAFNRANQIQPTAEAYTNLGVVYFYGGRYDDEARAYELALRQNPNAYDTWGNLAGAYERMGGAKAKVRSAYEEAERKAEAYLGINPKDLDALYALADYALNLGQPDRVLEILQRAHRVGGETVQQMVYAGSLYEQLGRRDDAERWVSRAIESGYPVEDLESYPALSSLIQESDIGVLE